MGIGDEVGSKFFAVDGDFNCRTGFAIGVGEVEVVFCICDLAFDGVLFPVCGNTGGNTDAVNLRANSEQKLSCDAVCP